MTQHDPPAELPSDEAALLIHARALDELRRSQSGLAQELAQGRQVREGLEELGGALTHLAVGQAELARELAETRRRLLAAQRRGTLLGLAALLVLVGAAWLLLGDREGSWFERGTLAADKSAAERESELSEAADAAEATRAGDLAGELDRERQRSADLRTERNRFVGEVARLRTDLVAAEQRFAAFTEVGLMQPEAALIEAPVVSRTSERDASAEMLGLNAALESGGVRSVRVIEFGAKSDGGLQEVLLHRVDLPTGERGVETWESLALEARDGELVLRLSDEGREDVVLPMQLAGAEALSRTPLRVPPSLLRLATAREALAGLFRGQDLEIVRIGGFENGTLLDLELRDLRGGSSGEPQQLRAARGRVLEVGPTLLLQEGTLTVDGAERPFWRGEYRRALSGADVGSYERALLESP